MAEARLKFLIDLEDRVSGGLQKIDTNLANFKKEVDNMKPAFEKMAAVGTAGFAAVSAAIGFSVAEATNAEKTQARLKQIVQTSTGATDEQVASLLRQADALEKVGVVSADAIIQAQGQLASFDLQAESIERLIPSMLNYAVAEKGINASAEDLQSLTNSLAQALNGNFAALTKVGFVLDDETKAMIANGTETERIIALNEVLDSTYAGLNERMRDTTEGAIFGLNASLGKLKESIGSAFLPALNRFVEKITPVVEKITSWVEKNPDLAATILVVSGAAFGLLAAIGALGLIIPTIIAGFQALVAITGVLATVMSFLLGPIGLILLAIAALVAAGWLIYKNWDAIASFATSIWNSIVSTITGAVSSVVSFVSGAWASLIDNVSNGMLALAETISAAWATITSAFWTAVNFYIGLWASLLDFLLPGWDETLGQMVFEAIQFFQKVAEVFTLILSKTSEIFTSILGFIAQVWASIGETFSAAADSVGSAFTEFLDGLAAYWSGIWTGVKEVFESIWTSIASIFDSIVGGIRSAMESLVAPIQKVIDLAQKALALAGGVGKGASKSVSKLLDSIISRGASITGKATGGPVSGGTPYIVGERGPELFVPGMSGSIVPNHALAGAGAGGITVVIQGNTLLDRDSARKIGDEMVRYLKSNFRI